MNRLFLASLALISLIVLFLTPPSHAQLLTLNLGVCPIKGVGLFRTLSQLDVTLNLQAYLNVNFKTAFPSGIVVGDVLGLHLFFSAAADVFAFLPCTASASILNGTIIGPVAADCSVAGGVLAGEILALSIAVGLDLFDPHFYASPVPLSALVVVKGDCIGMTVAQVLALANQVLAGKVVLPASLTLAALTQCVIDINLNFSSGLVNNLLLAVDSILASLLGITC